MSGSTLSSAGLDAHRKRTLYRAWHRGTREMDLIIGMFADAFLPTCSDADLVRFESVIDEQDVDLLKWFIGQAPLPDTIDREMFEQIRAFKNAGAL